MEDAEMKRAGIYIFSAVALIGVAFFAARFYTHAPLTTPPVKSAADAVDVKQRILTFSIDGKTSKGMKKWHLEGKAAEMVGEEIYLEDLNVTAYTEEHTVTLASDKGIYRRAKAEVELIGNVKVVSEDGTVLTADHATWFQATREITTDSVVNIEQQSMRATGTGGVADIFEKKAVLRADVTVEMEPATLIKCDGALEVDFNENKAVFSRNVRVKDKDGSLFSDVLTVYIDPVTHKVAEVIAEGNVKVRKGESYTVCEKATYTDGTGSVRLEGKPRVVIAPEELNEARFFRGIGAAKQ
ncbi:MAG: LPS export ABC transporter periplasmic protein LptC [Candidatus Omnitrophica bacterium]|nr:LPS export ABC transporter periplasmic protein LptC [Candidatus Omnitrophota bacterium]